MKNRKIKSHRDPYPWYVGLCFCQVVLLCCWVAVAQGLNAVITYLGRHTRVVADWAGCSIFAGPETREIRIGDYRDSKWHWAFDNIALLKCDFDRANFEACVKASSGN